MTILSTKELPSISFSLFLVCSYSGKKPIFTTKPLNAYFRCEMWFSLRFCPKHLVNADCLPSFVPFHFFPASYFLRAYILHISQKPDDLSISIPTPLGKGFLL